MSQLEERPARVFQGQLTAGRTSSSRGSRRSRGRGKSGKAGEFYVPTFRITPYRYQKIHTEKSPFGKSYLATLGSNPIKGTPRPHPRLSRSAPRVQLRRGFGSNGISTSA
jgi:hypothetical protein